MTPLYVCHDSLNGFSKLAPLKNNLLLQIHGSLISAVHLERNESCHVTWLIPLQVNRRYQAPSCLSMVPISKIHSVSHDKHMHESCHTYECSMQHIWTSQLTRMTVPCHTYECAMILSVGLGCGTEAQCVTRVRDSLICVAVCCNVLQCVLQCVAVCCRCSSVGLGCVTHPYADSFIYVIWLIHVCDMACTLIQHARITAVVVSSRVCCCRF